VTRERRGWGPFSGGQLTAIILGLAFAVAVPVGAHAAVAGSNVFVTDDTSGKHAKVDASGNVGTLDSHLHSDIFGQLLTNDSHLKTDTGGGLKVAQQGPVTVNPNSAVVTTRRDAVNIRDILTTPPPGRSSVSNFSPVVSGVTYVHAANYGSCGLQLEFGVRPPGTTSTSFLTWRLLPDQNIDAELPLALEFTKVTVAAFGGCAFAWRSHRTGHAAVTGTSSSRRNPRIARVLLWEERLRLRL
jgi:hypothetical protein